MAKHSPKSRARYLAEYATRKMTELKNDMGGKCHRCGEADLDKLEFHHPLGRSYEPSSMSRWMRAVQYRRDWNTGLLVLACVKCNRSEGASRAYASSTAASGFPF
jgi:hypothetical protein